MKSARQQSQEPNPQHLTPPLKWAGGKRWLIPTLQKLWTPYANRRLVEPFVGGLAVSLGLLPKVALLCDRNEHAINFYRHLQRGLKIPFPMKYDKDRFYRQRKRFNDLIAERNSSSAEAAGLFYYLNRTCYNGLCRFNSTGAFNVPFGRYTTVNYTHDFSEYRPLLRSWKFIRADFEKLLPDPTDFIYADPPYDVEFTKYSKDDFVWEDQERLALWLSRHHGPVVASNQATSRITNLYRSLGFSVRTVDAPRMISCTGDRTRAKEMLAVRNL